MPLFYILVYWPQDMWDLNSQPRDWTHAPYPGKQSLNHWMPGESQECSFRREWRVPLRVCLRSQPWEQKGVSRAGVKWAHQPSGRVSESQGAWRGVTEDSVYLGRKIACFFKSFAPLLKNYSSPWSFVSCTSFLLEADLSCHFLGQSLSEVPPSLFPASEWLINGSGGFPQITGVSSYPLLWWMWLSIWTIHVLLCIEKLKNARNHISFFVTIHG